nr:glucosyltransferase domain-containing protein [Pseudomonas sp. dw_358]
MSPAQARWFFLLAVLAFALPFILADYRYVDDNWRSELDVQRAWRVEGRILAEVFYRIMTFSGVTVDIFPLPLLLACVAMAFALAALVKHYFIEPRLSHCLVVLPLWYSPMYLGNLTYQYDGPTMTLSMVAAIYAVIWRGRNTLLNVLVPGCLLGVALCLYQVTVNVFVGLCCIELIRAVRFQLPGRSVCSLLGRQLGQLVLGLFVYYASAYQLMHTDRKGMLPLNAEGLGELGLRAGRIMHKISLFITDGNGWMWIALAVLAAIGYLWIALRQLRALGLAGLGGVLIYLLVPLVLAFSIGGMILPFAEFTLEARTLMGLSPVLVALFYLAQFSLSRVHPRLEWLLVIPLMCMLSLSFVYGRVLAAQKTLERSLAQDLHHDITRLPELRNKPVYWTSVDCTGAWLPALSGTLENLPALRFVLSLKPCEMDTVENLTDLNLEANDDLFLRLMVHSTGQRLVDNKYYDIWLLNGYGYVNIKPVDKTPKLPSE